MLNRIYFVDVHAYRIIAPLPFCLDLVWWQDLEDLEKKLKGQVPQQGEVEGELAEPLIWS